jgi:hypothetical protein
MSYTGTLITDLMSTVERVEKFKELCHRRDLAAYAVVGCARVVVEGNAGAEELRRYVNDYDSINAQVRAASDSL